MRHIHLQWNCERLIYGKEMKMKDLYVSLLREICMRSEMIYLAPLQNGSKSETLWKKQAVGGLKTGMMRSQFSGLCTVWHYPLPSSMGNLFSLKKWIQRSYSLGDSTYEKEHGWGVRRVDQILQSKSRTPSLPQASCRTPAELLTIKLHLPQVLPMHIKLPDSFLVTHPWI